MLLLVTTSHEGLHVSDVTKNDDSGSQQAHADNPLVTESDLQSILHEYKDCFPEVLSDGLPPERDAAHTTLTERCFPEILSDAHAPFQVCPLSGPPKGSVLAKMQKSTSDNRGSQERHHSAQLINLWGTGLVCQREGWE